MELVWLGWSLAFLAVWCLVLAGLKDRGSRHEMLVVSAWTSLLALTEPLFVPRYWNPPSLFGLAQSTGFDVESFIFCWSIGGLAVVLYELLVPVRHEPVGRGSRTHAFHPVALVVTPVSFAVLDLATGLNPIYGALLAFALGSALVVASRPDLLRKMLVSAFVFLGLYSAYFFTLIVAVPGYVQRVWDLRVLSGASVLGIPLEELAFAFAFGFFWSGIYEYALSLRLRQKAGGGTLLAHLAADLRQAAGRGARPG
ncbi:MAG TPA: lycopene cyclase domain-containing protein [Methanomicrobiales archaeon]|nr:lycopene cyclase domain-containing protein [Methanomicrobiales archaeon]